eukprot:COSAG02_NODE_11413_length_1729_cov_0.899387_2_plen_54_part_00
MSTAAGLSVRVFISAANGGGWGCSTYDHGAALLLLLRLLPPLPPTHLTDGLTD